MGRFSELDIDDSDLADSDDFPDFLAHEPTGEEVLDMQIAALLSELNSLIAYIEAKVVRIKYYNEIMEPEDVDHVRDELKRLVREFR